MANDVSMPILTPYLPVLKRFFITALLGSCPAVYAQERLSLQDAIAQTLKNNFDISIATNATQQAAANNTLGNAGFLPNANLNASTSASRSNVYNQLANGSEQNNPKAGSHNLNPSVAVNWTLYDGGRMFLVKKQLTQLEALSQTQLKAQVQVIVSRTIQTYAQVVWRKQQQVATDTAVALAKARMELAKLKFETGAGAKVDYLQARVDYNNRRTESLNAMSAIAQAADSLAVLMGENDGKQYDTDDSLTINTQLQPIDQSILLETNLSLGALRQSAEIATMDARIAGTYALPTLVFNGGYNYSRTTNATGFALFSRSFGPNGSLALSMPIFQGGNIKRQEKVASLQAMREGLIYDRQKTILGRAYRTAWRNYQIAVSAYKLQLENIGIARENLDVQQMRFRLGVGNTLESRQAETDYVAALVQLYTAAYTVKTNETIVKELGNTLLE